MASTGDLVTPKLYGEPWFEKPILYYWCAAAGFKIFHSPEVAARIPSALAALLGAFTIAWLVWIFYGWQSAWISLLIFPTTIATAAFARAATPDMLFTSWLTVAMAGATGIAYRAGALRQLVPEAPPVISSDLPDLIAFGAGLGLATLAKGPAALILAGGSIAIWIGLTRSWRLIPRFFRPVSLLAFAVIALPWYVLCALRNPTFVQTFLLLHNFERYLTPVFQHRQPVWYFEPILLMALLPWTALLAAAVREGARMFHLSNWKNSPGLFFACWAIFPVVFFSFSQSKLPGYILPAIPSFAIVLAVSATRMLSDSSLFSRLVLGCVGLTWIVGLAARVPHMLRFLPASIAPRMGSDLHTLIAIAAATGFVIFVLAVLRRQRAAVILTAMLFASMIELANRTVLPQLDPYISARESAAKLENAAGSNKLATYELQRSWYWGLNFYLREQLPEWTSQQAGTSLVVTNEKGLQKIRATGRNAVPASALEVSPEALPVVVQSALQPATQPTAK